MPNVKVIKSIPQKNLKIRKSQKRGRKTLFHSDLCQLARKQMLATGKAEDCYRALGISADTYHRWIKQFPEFSEAISLAREERRKISERDYLEEATAAINGIRKLLNGYSFTETEIREEEILDSSTGQNQTNQIKRVKVTREKHIPPNMAAIAKVLGDDSLPNIILLKSIEKFKLDDSKELYQYVFGALSAGSEVEEFTGVYVLDQTMDLVKLRYMEGLVQKQYDDDLITLDKYLSHTSTIRNDFSRISEKMEQRAQSLLEGKSYQQILYDYEMFCKSLIDTVSDVLLEVNFPEGTTFRDIIKEIVDRMNESREKGLFPIKKLPRP